ncbi:guanine nucleotide exchange factor DBS-like isoform X2 [Gigantopelta aegis]|uniref:guanine nucleotide exchange factor DBS-like isoform X2 n=1 Tax=Gigantopelta aegis TaxID=1735272 RepID=UPI001B8883FB|nr:guanine nucleotide exchange factor DBS-like isoform X2 [Gigantopelta aegis]
MSSISTSPEPECRIPGPHEIEEEIANFVESFKQKSSYLDRRSSLESSDTSCTGTSGWTSSAYSTTDDTQTSTTNSPDKEEGAKGFDPDTLHKRNGIIAESRRISEWAWLTSKESFDYTEPDSLRGGVTSENSAGESSDVMGESCQGFGVLDVAKLLQARFVCLSGGKALNGAAILTFPDCPQLPEVPDEDYRKVVTYLCSIPQLQNSDAGFVIVIDRRNDSWSSVKAILLKIRGFFPYHIQVVFLLQPKGFFQRAFADFRSKFVKEELEFKVILCDSPVAMLDYVDPSQLNYDVGGAIDYDPNEWTQNRAAIEKFESNINTISATITAMVKKLEEADLPNDVAGTEALIRNHIQERKELHDDLNSATEHGLTILKCIRGDNLDVPLVQMIHVAELERLLAQLEKTKKKFAEFWRAHELKLRQCLKLRQFEEEFKLIQFNLGRRVEELEQKMQETGDCLSQVETHVTEFQTFQTTAERDLTLAENMRSSGEQLIADEHYAVDCIRPKCMELQRMCEQYKELLRRRNEILIKSQDLHDRLEKANRWCNRGVDMLANQPIEQCQTQVGADKALREIEHFLGTVRDLKLSNPREFHQAFDGMMTTETRAVVQQVLKRIEDVQKMCEKRKESLRSLASKPSRSRPVQHVLPEPMPPQTPASTGYNGFDQTDLDPEVRRKVLLENNKRSPLSLEKSARHRVFDKSDIQHPIHINSPAYSSSASSNSSLAHMSDISMATDSNTQRSSYSSMSSSSLPEIDTLQTKRRHVMNELIETETTYVRELEEIYTGYYLEMNNRSMQHLIPPELEGKKNILFGNLEQIYKFHKDDFLQELQNCREVPAKVGRCFINRKEEFQWYSVYCQNKPKSEALRTKIGDSNPFFKECQRRLGHKLPLGAFLLKPIQRITKYQLLLKEMLRFTGEDRELESQLQEAVDTMLGVLRYLNDSMHQVSIVGYSENLSDLGRLLMHGSFSVWTEHKKDRIRDLRFKAMHRHMFLYERSLLLCKKKEDNQNSDGASYAFKKKLKLSQVGLTENIKGDKKKFELWLRGREEVYTIQAPSLEVKDAWVKEIKKVLLNQFDDIKVVHTTTNPISEEHLSSHMMSQNNSIKSIDNWRSQHSLNNNTTVPIGLGMVSPIDSPSSPTQAVDYGDDEGWSSGEFSNTDEDECPDQYIPKIEPAFREHFVSLGDYVPVDSNELGFAEGDVLEILRVGTNGWWYAKHLSNYEEGWVPSTYLESASQRVSPSISSSESFGGRDYYHSRASLASTSTTNSPEETTV